MLNAFFDIPSDVFCAVLGITDRRAQQVKVSKETFALWGEGVRFLIEFDKLVLEWKKLKMQKVCKTIFEERSILSTENDGASGDVVSVKEIFRLQRQGALSEDEGKYLPSEAASTRTYTEDHYLREK